MPVMAFAGSGRQKSTPQEVLASSRDYAALHPLSVVQTLFFDPVFIYHPVFLGSWSDPTDGENTVEV